MLDMQRMPYWIAVFFCCFALTACGEPTPGFTGVQPDEPSLPLPPEETDDPEDEDDDLPPDTTPPTDPSPPIGTVQCHDGYKLTYWHARELDGNGGSRVYPLQRCAPDGVVAVIPRKSVWEITVNNLKRGDRVHIHSPHYFTDEQVGELRTPRMQRVVPRDGQEIVMNYEADFGGEHLLIINTYDPEAEHSAVVKATCTSNCDLITTRFPVIMLHGFLGTDSYFGILDYFSGIISPLRNLGLEVYTPSAGLLETSTARAQAFASQIDDAIAETGARKVNIVAHSQGGLDARVIASPNGLKRGDNIASLTTVSTPHHGIPIPLLDVVTGIINLIFDFPNFSTQEARDFNRQYIDDSRVDYHSWAFRTCDPEFTVTVLCALTSGGERVHRLLQPFHRAILAVGVLGNGNLLEDNDGLVTVSSARWGPSSNQHGPLWADHLDQIGQIARLPNSENFNHVTFYQDWVRELILRGH